MDLDDMPVGRVLSRREIMQIFGAAFVAGSSHLVANQSASAVGVPDCVVRPEQTEGPFFTDVELERSDIRMDPSTNSVSPGLPLGVTIQVLRVGSEECVPLPGAQVDLWQCDAAGRYSGFRDRGSDLRDQKFLRGYQLTDQDGMARFMTIYPGWYRGRAVHLHFKIRAGAEQGKRYEFTSQLYFDDELTDQVHAEPPYDAHGTRTVRNSDDRIFRRSRGRLTLETTPSDTGYQALFPIGLDLSDAG